MAHHDSSSECINTTCSISSGALSLVRHEVFRSICLSRLILALETAPPGSRYLSLTRATRFFVTNLALNSEWFRYAWQKFHDAELDEAGLNPDDRHLLEFMGEQELVHVSALGNLLGGPEKVFKPHNYTYLFDTVEEFVDLSQKSTPVGGSGAFGFIPHLDSRPNAPILL
ncbi:hypothetical protein BDV93DRAFT_611986 [Ceratobasidium sp. AG-I]|nr:hypothetical protein BDV93DRAFT_611986 [Ceratobasidium sp. AG-I]